MRLLNRQGMIGEDVLRCLGAVLQLGNALEAGDAGAHGGWATLHAIAQ